MELSTSEIFSIIFAPHHYSNLPLIPPKLLSFHIRIFLSLHHRILVVHHHWFTVSFLHRPAVILQPGLIIETKDVDHLLVWWHVRRCSQRWTELSAFTLKSSPTLNPQWTILVTMSKPPAPETKIWQAFVLKRHPRFLPIFKSYYSPSTQRQWYINLNSYSGKTTAFLSFNNNWSDQLSNIITYIFCHFRRHVSHGDIMNLHRKHQSRKIRTLVEHPYRTSQPPLSVWRSSMFDSIGFNLHLAYHQTQIGLCGQSYLAS